MWRNSIVFDISQIDLFYEQLSCHPCLENEKTYFRCWWRDPLFKTEWNTIVDTKWDSWTLLFAELKKGRVEFLHKKVIISQTVHSNWKEYFYFANSLLRDKTFKFTFNIFLQIQESQTVNIEWKLFTKITLWQTCNVTTEYTTQIEKKK